MFLPGFSTAPRKTELAGRGVGLDVVRTNLDALNGEIEIETRKGIGTRFTLKVPLTLIISQALFVRVGKYTFAFPLSFVEEIRRVRAGDDRGGRRQASGQVRDSLTEVVHLDAQLGLERVRTGQRLVSAGGGQRWPANRSASSSKKSSGKDEIVIKNLGEYLRNVKMFPGATIAPDGSLILLVDLNRLVVGESIERRPLMTAANAARIFLPGAVAVAAGEIPRRGHRTDRKGEAGAAGRRFHQRPQVCRPHAGKSRLPCAPRLRRTGGAGDRRAGRGRPGGDRPGDAAHQRLRTDASLAAKSGDARDSGDGCHLARRQQAPRPRRARRRQGVHGQAGAGRTIGGAGQRSDRQFRAGGFIQAVGRQ